MSDEIDAAAQTIKDYVADAEKRIAELEKALRLAFDYADEWTTKQMQDHCWKALEKKENRLDS